MCIRDRLRVSRQAVAIAIDRLVLLVPVAAIGAVGLVVGAAVSYTHLRAHETVLDLVCRLLLEKKKHT